MSRKCEKGAELAAKPKKQFTCPFPNCGRLFRTKFSMKRHSLIHSQNKQYICKHCGKKFALPQYLKEHIYTHTQDKPYVCGVAGCEKRFRQAGKLSLHRRTHKEYALKQYECQANFAEDKEEKECEEAFLKLPSEEPKKPEGGSSDRQFLRQNSGQTTASGNNNFREDLLKDDDAHCIGDDHDEQELIFNEPVPEGPGLTQEALNKFNESVDAGDTLLKYLDFLNSPLVVNLRPVLPLPPNGRLKPPVPSQEFRQQPDLFELVKKYTDG